MIEIIFLIFCLASIYPNLAPYRPLHQGRYWWTKAWSFHAVALVSFTLALKLFKIDIPFLGVLSGTLMITTGFGLAILFLVHYLENRKKLFPPKIIIPHHFLMGLIGIWFLISSRIEFPDLIFIYPVLILYAIIIFPRGFDVNFILYEKSRLPTSTRRKLMQISTALLFLGLPLVSLETAF